MLAFVVKRAFGVEVDKIGSTTLATAPPEQDSLKHCLVLLTFGTHIKLPG